MNDHIKEGVSIDGAPDSGLEKQIEAAVTAGDISTAEKLSDRLSARNVSQFNRLIIITDHTES